MPENWSETELAELCSCRCVAAENELYRRYASRLHGLCLRYLNEEDAKDMVHDVMIKVLGNIEGFEFRGDGSLYSWMKRITINKILDDTRRRRNRFSFLSLDLIPEPSEEEPDMDLLKEVPASTLLEFVSNLPEGRRMVFSLYCIDGYSHEDISRMLNISSKGSAAILSKAKRQLKIMINNYLQNR